MIDRLLGRTVDDTPYDAAEPWEGPGDEDDLRAYTARRLGSYAHRPRSPQDVPVGALEALRAALGKLGGNDLVILPRTPRVTGAGERMWAVTPTSVLGRGRAGRRTLGGRAGPGHRRHPPVRRGRRHRRPHDPAPRTPRDHRRRPVDRRALQHRRTRAHAQGARRDPPLVLAPGPAPSRERRSPRAAAAQVDGAHALVGHAAGRARWAPGRRGRAR